MKGTIQHYAFKIFNEGYRRNLGRGAFNSIIKFVLVIPNTISYSF